MAEAGAAATQQNLPGMRDRLKVDVEPAEMGGVKVLLVTPEKIPPENRNRLLIHIHGGCYVLNPGEAGLPEAILMAGFGAYRVISVDYRMPPEAYFPAALDDGIAVWKAALQDDAAEEHGGLRHLGRRRADARDGAEGQGSSACRCRRRSRRARRCPTPPGRATPSRPMRWWTTCWSSPDGFCDAATMFYANGHDMKDPLISPVYGDMSGFPPTILTSGTRDLLLSNTVRVHRKLRQAGVEAVAAGIRGACRTRITYRDDTAPETNEAFDEIAGFFDKHLGK